MDTQTILARRHGDAQIPPGRLPLSAKQFFADFRLKENSFEGGWRIANVRWYCMQNRRRPHPACDRHPSTTMTTPQESPHESTDTGLVEERVSGKRSTTLSVTQKDLSRVDDGHVDKNSSEGTLHVRPTQTSSYGKKTPSKHRELAELRKNAAVYPSKKKPPATMKAGPLEATVCKPTHQELAERRKNESAGKEKKVKEERKGQVTESQVNSPEIVTSSQAGGLSLSPFNSNGGGTAPGALGISGNRAYNVDTFDSAAFESTDSDDSKENIDTPSPIAAHTVEDELEAVVVGFGDDAFQFHNEEQYEKELQQSRRRRLCTRAGAVAICLVVTVIAAIVGISVASSPAEVLATPAPTVSLAPTQSSSSIPSSPPTATPTVSPTTAFPTTSPKQCFQTHRELVTAVDLYVQDNGPETEVAATYGWPIGVWCIGNITSLEDVFNGERNPDMVNFNEKIGAWDVSRVTNMKGTFEEATAFDHDISGWDVSRVETFENCFNGAVAFDQSLESWDVGSATTFHQFFQRAFRFGETFPQNLTAWRTSGVFDMKGCFESALNFSGDISTWDVSHVITMRRMFVNSGSVDLSGWDVSGVTDMSRMFSLNTRFNSDISRWDVSRVTDMGFMFNHTVSFNQDISTWNMSSVQKADDMFQRAQSFRQDLCAWGSSDTGLALPASAKVESMFEGAIRCDSTESPDYTLDPPGPFCVACNT